MRLLLRRLGVIGGWCRRGHVNELHCEFGRVLGSLVASTLTTAACEQTQTSRFGRPSSQFPGVRSAQTKLLSIPPSGTEMDAPQKVRFYRYRDETRPRTQE